ncbi:MAG: tRNA(fMet)-specific endonuclease VapC [Pseudomonadota bacterium]|jgi:predicted nucleic acid-binding protein
MVDTSVLVELENGSTALLPDGELIVSVLSVMELQMGIEGAVGRRRARRQAYLDHVLETYTVISADLSTSIAAGRLFQHLEQRGQRIGYSDTWIAASALVRGEPVVTCNVKHFARVPLLTVIAFTNE